MPIHFNVIRMRILATLSIQQMGFYTLKGNKLNKMFGTSNTNSNQFMWQR